MKTNGKEPDLKKMAETSSAYNLFMQAPVGFGLLKGNDHLVELANASFLKLTGRDNTIIGKTMAEIFPEVESQGYLALLNQVLKDRKTIFLNESPAVFLKNGIRETFFINTFLQPYYEGDTVAGILSILTDVTEQVVARKKVEDAEQRARVAMESAGLGMYEGNLLTNVMTGDERFYQLFGFDQWVPWNDLIFSIHPEDLPSREMAHKQSLITGRLEYEARVIYKDRSIHWLKIYGKVFYDEHKTPVKILGVAGNITEQKFMERQKDDFLSMASHELKTPVTTIKVYGQIAEDMLEKKGDLQALGMIKKMSSQVNKLTALIEDLLDFTKIHKGKLIYNEATFHFNELVKEVIDDMQKTSPSHLIKNNLNEKADVFGDRDKLGQVLNNLISNAIKYSPEADNIIISSVLEEKGVRLSVQDFGIGISQKDQKNVFEQFYRVTGDNQSTFPGMGIGLYICSEIISRQGGKIWVESTIDEGSVFYIWLPFDHRQNT